MSGDLVSDERGKRGAKSAAAFRTISEVATDLSVPSHVLRFWETKFSQVKPLKRGGGRRYYRPEDVALLRNIRSLLYEDGYTIKGVQKLLREGGGRMPADESKSAKHPPHSQALRSVQAAESGGGKGVKLPARTRGVLTDVLRELEELRDILQKD
jgi:DNA-binding transcriptional MerR regulator